jgi:hypothetical protein
MEEGNSTHGLFKNSLKIFEQALASDLKMFPARQMGCLPLQCVDDLLLTGRCSEDCLMGTHVLKISGRLVTRFDQKLKSASLKSTISGHISQEVVA